MCRLLCIIVILSNCGCGNGSKSRQTIDVKSKTSPQSAEDVMYDLARKECLYCALKNVDRPFEAKAETAVLMIDPSDPWLAQITMYVTYTEKGKSVRKLFFVMLKNTRAPDFAKEQGDFECLLVNCSGHVLERSDEFFEGMDDEVLKNMGGSETDGPPFLAETISRANKNR